MAALVLVVASGAAIALVTTPGTSSMLPVVVNGVAATVEPDDPREAPGGAGVETGDDTRNPPGQSVAPGRPVAPDPDDSLDTPGSDTDN